MSSYLPPLIPSLPLLPRRDLSNTKAPILTYAASSEQTAPLDAGDVLMETQLLLQGSILNDAAPAGTVRAMNPYEFIQNVRVNGPGGDIINASALALRVLQGIRNPHLDDFNDITAAEAAVGGATVPFRGLLRLQYTEPRCNPGWYGVMCTGLQKQEGAFKVFTRFSSGIAGLVDGGNATIPTAPTVNVSKVRLEGLSEIAPQGYGTHLALATTENANVQATAVAKPFNLRRSQYLHAIILVCKQGANLNLSDLVLPSTGYIRVKVGGVPVFEKTVADCRAMLPQLLGPNWPTYTGQIVLPFAFGMDKDPNAVNTRAVYLPQSQECTLELDITGAATNQVEILQVGREDVDVAAARFGLAAA